jgi:hypothetical protein
MSLPFSHREFELVFTVYNAVIWPLQPIAHAIGLVMLAWLFAPSPRGARLVLACLAALWGWTGLVYHVGFFSSINTAAFAFGAAFVLQSALLIHATKRGQLAFDRAGAGRKRFAWALLLYSAVLYPLVGMWLGRSYMDLPAFGVTPCPLTLTTLGALLLAGPSVPLRLYVVPIAWAFIGGSAAALLRMPQDWPLLLAGAATLIVVMRDQRHRRRGQAGIAVLLSG